MGNVRIWLIAIAGSSLIGSLGLSYVYDAVYGWFYSFLEILMMGIAITSMVVSTKNYLNRKKRFKKQIKEDLLKMPAVIQNVKERAKQDVPYVVSNQEPLLMSLEEQFEYAKRLRSGKLHIKSELLRNIYGIYDVPSDEVMKVSDWLSTKNFGNLVDSLGRKGIISSDQYYRLEAFDWGIGLAFDKYVSKGRFQESTYLPTFTRIKEWTDEKDRFTYRITQGVYGEKEVVDSLKPLLRAGTILENIRIEDQGTSSESDIIYVGPTGLFTLEVKNIGAAGKWNIKISKDGQWQKVYPSGDREAMNDIGGQLNHHISSQERFLNRKLKERYGPSAPYVKMKGAVVISNDSVIVDNDSDLIVRRKSSLNRYLEEGPEELSGEWQDRVIAIFKEYTLPGKRYEVMNFEAILENILLDQARRADYSDLRYSWIVEWLKNEGQHKAAEEIMERIQDKWKKEEPIYENEVSA